MWKKNKILRSLYSFIRFFIKKMRVKKIKHIYEMPKIKSINETIEYIIENKSSVSRYGDGEIDIMLKDSKIAFQSYNEKLSKRLIEVQQSNYLNHLVCLPDIFSDLKGYRRKSKRFWISLLEEKFVSWSQYLDPKREYYNAFITRPYIMFNDKDKSKYYFAMLKEIWNNREIVVIEGDKSRLGFGNDLFDNATNIQRIICPSENAFDKYEEILISANKLDKSKLLLIALGPTATVLAYDLHRNGYQAIDIGHIDIEYEWFLRKAKEKVKIDNKYTNEASDGDGRNIQELKDKNYLDEIKVRI
ncbi:SP_1767 family glycosyltransferase [Halobacillus halophilus]|uniref:SP_1767 family glycosyltransferase n=1 Tax=Halobacillus halophilus TaxID=1570 RepID=UPI00136B2B9B|nr:SP_1767 family glycosyltransferase [Halobacillus halophilus]MYL30782.1 SP_1767 family glycosyltransferase [Halobacillus halophilus]